MGANIGGLEAKRIELEQNASNLQFQINDLKTKINQKKMQLKNFEKYYPDNTTSIESTKYAMKYLTLRLSTKEQIFNEVKLEQDNLHKTEVNIIKDEKAESEQVIKSENENIASQNTNSDKNSNISRFQKFGDYAKNAYGTAKTIHSFNLLFVLLVLIAIYIDGSVFFGKTFGEISFLNINIPIVILIELFFVFWFYLDARAMGSLSATTDTALIGLLLLLDFFILTYGLPFMGYNIPYFPVMLFLVSEKWKGSGTSVSLKSLIQAGLPFLIIGIVFSVIVPAIGSLPFDLGVGTASGSNDGLQGSAGSASGGSVSDGSSAKASPGLWDTFMCSVDPTKCPVEEDEEGSTGNNVPISDGTVNDVKYSLAQPTKTVSKTYGEDDYPYTVDFDWVVENKGLHIIDTALFLMNASQIQGNHSGAILNLEKGYSSYSDKVDYLGVTMSDDYFYYQYPMITGGRKKTNTVYLDVPQCSLAKFEAPIFVLYKYEVNSNLMLTFGEAEWWEALEDQDKTKNLKPTKSTSTTGPFTLSIYPKENQQPVLISDGERFMINFDLSNNHGGRAAISSFDIYISSKLVPQDLGGKRCAFKASSKPTTDSDLIAYTLKDDLFNEISSADLALDNGFKDNENYKCTFIYDSASFDKDFRGGSTQKYIMAHIDYTYIYNGEFILNTENITDVAVC